MRDFVSTPWEAIQTTRIETIKVGHHVYHIEMPEHWDALIEHPVMARAFAQDEYIPYWAYLWPASRMLAAYLDRVDLPDEIWELGCGLGLPGMVALQRGKRVVFTDYDLTTLEFVQRNVLHNGFTKWATQPLDWREPPCAIRVPLLIGADLIYEARAIEPLLELAAQMLEPDGELWLADPNRSTSSDWIVAIERRGWSYTTESIQLANTGEMGTIYRVMLT